MTFLICCVFVLSVQGIIGKPMNGSDITLADVIDDVHQLQQEMTATQQHLQAIENITNSGLITSDLPSIINLKAVYPEVIGFTVSLKQDSMDLPTGSTILYDDIYYNAGSAYDSSTGVFTCPRSGMYLFAIFVQAVNASPAANIAMKINGRPRVDATSERFVDGHATTGSNVLVEHIQAGDRVWVETHQFDNQELYRGYTTFSGVLIQST